MAVVRGLVDMFVDDMIGVGHIKSWKEDMMSAITIMKDPLNTPQPPP